MTMSASWEDFKRKVESLREVEKIASNNLKSFLRTCTHDEKIRMSQYSSGDYYNRASTDSWLECVVCGERSDVKEQIHNHY